MRRLVLAAIIAVSAAVLAIPATAQTTSPPPADEDITESHLRTAARLIDLLAADQTFDEILPLVAGRTQAVFTQTNPALTREIEEATQEAAIKLVPQRLELSRTLQLIWARRFTEEEMNELIEIFSEPLGRKYIELSAVIAALSFGAAEQWQQRLAAEMVTETRNILREKGHAL